MSRINYFWIFVLFFRLINLPAQVATPTQLSTNLAATSAQGTSISLDGIDPLSCPQVTMTQTWSGGKLIFSDSPESPLTSGMLYVDTNLTATIASLPNRIFLYHVNSNSMQRMKFSVLVQNRGNTNGTLVVKQSGTAGPSQSYSYVGQIAFARWLTNAPGTITLVAPGQTVRLDTNFDSITAAKNYLMHGIWDYTFDQPHTLVICALYSTDDPVSVGPTLPVLARDGHERGTFTNCNKIYNASSAQNTVNGVVQFSIAGNTSTDANAAGHDYAVTPPTSESNSGNYGVVYQISVNTFSGDARGFGLLINPRAGAWSGAVNTPANLYPGGDFILPNGGGTLSDNTQGVVAGSYYAGKNTEPITLQFMPTGGVSFPVRAVLVPFTPLTPILAILNNYTINPGQTVSFTESATGTNTHLSLSLLSGPSGAAITTNGVFNWRATAASAGSTNVIKLVAADNSNPPYTNAQSFLIAVNPLGSVSVTSLVKNPTTALLTVSAPVGPDYILQAKNSLTDAVWLNLLTNTPTSSPFSLLDTTAGSVTNRFYRLQLSP